MALADFCTSGILEHCFGQARSWVQKTHYYFGLTTGELLSDGSNIEVELSGSGYSRKIYANSSFFWAQHDSGIFRNIGYLEWDASGNWNTVSGLFISDNNTVRESSGIIAISLLSNPKTIISGDKISLSPSGVTITLT